MGNIINQNGQVKVGFRTPPSKLLDIYTGASAAYSLRKLTSNYSGSAIRVRRSSDNTSQDIGFDVNGNLDTASMLSFVGANNTALYSEELDNVYWTKKNTTVTTNQITAPDGTTTVDLVSETTTSDTHGISPNYVSTSFPAGTSWNISCYVKKGPGANAPNTFGVGFQHGLGADTTVLFSFVTEGEIDRHSNSNDSNIGSSMVSVGNGWYRCSVWGTVAVTHSKVACGSFRFNNNSNIFSTNGYVGKTDANIYIWGWQFVRALNDTSVLTTQPYTKTTATAAGNGFVSTWFDQSGNGRDVSQITAANQPRIVSGGIIDVLSGKPSIYFDGSNDCLDRTDTGMPTLGTTVLHVSKYNSSSVEQAFVVNWGQGSAARAFYNMYFNTGLGLSNYGEALFVGGRLNTNNLTVITKPNATGYQTWRIYINSTNTSSSSLNSQTTLLNSSGGFRIGRVNPSQANTYAMLGYISELVVWPSDLNTQRTSLETNANTYYSIY